MSGTII